MSLEVEVTLCFFFLALLLKGTAQEGLHSSFPMCSREPRLHHVFYHLALELPSHALILPEIHLCTSHTSPLWFLSQGMASSSEQKHIFPHP